MKISIRLIALSVLFSSLSAFADGDIDVSNTSVINLALDQSSASIVVAYPGPAVSGLCGVEIRADSYRRDLSIQAFWDAVQLVNPVGTVPVGIVKNDITVSIDLSSAINGYQADFTLQTKDGSSLSDTITRTLGSDRTVVLVGTSCN